MELPVFGGKKLTSAPSQKSKKKVLKPIRTHTLSATRRKQCTSNTPYQTTYISHTRIHSNLSNVNKLITNDHMLQIKQLENQLVEARMKTRDLITENRLLKTLEKRHENALSMYEGKQAKLPQVIKSYDEEINVLKSQIRQIKVSYKEMENRYKSQSTELLSIQKQHKHLLELSKDKQLSKREQLTDQLADAQNTIKQQYDKMQNLMKKLELQNKTHKYQINSESIKMKELQLKIKQLQDENQNLKSQLDKLRTKNYGVKQIFTKGITEESISITPRVVKPVPTMHGQGDDTDESFYKTNGSISLKPESLHEEYEDDYSIKNFQTNSTNQIKIKSKRIKETNSQINSEINEKSYSSNMPSSQNNLSWLNQGLVKLMQENKPEPSSRANSDTESRNEHETNVSYSLPTTSMSRTQKDLLLANLDLLSEDENDFKIHYKSKLSNLPSNTRYQSLNSDDGSSESLTSD